MGRAFVQKFPQALSATFTGFRDSADMLLYSELKVAYKSNFTTTTKLY